MNRLTGIMNEKRLEIPGLFLIPILVHGSHYYAKSRKTLFLKHIGHSFCQGNVCLDIQKY